MERFPTIVLLLVALCYTFLSAYCAPVASEAQLDALKKNYSGDGTFYAPGLGACGVTNSAGQLIVAVGHGVFDSFPGADESGNPNNNPICGRKLKATYQGKSVEVSVQDRCAGCAGAADLDFTEAGFKKLSPLAVGRLKGVQWEWL
ncbi:barwin-like endoglucanase [Roridomyces roridus]|uniref:Barwin-like endoglucanase n=1 Tax=Roridomyces roridus TaxID=1738132 RepID=A0AAD7FCP8_9AGAR|nr:barwin-like endoglucanase [Roridomyces roridus]